MPGRPVYLDCCATSPVEEEVIELMTFYLRTEFGNAGSRTHEYGTAAAKAVRTAREQVADAIDASWDEVTFTSGATESNNLAVLGLAARARGAGHIHVVASSIEHKAVLEPLQELERHGATVTWVNPGPDGRVSAKSILAAVREDTILVSVMHVNNETGVIQPIAEIADRLTGHPAILHTDAAQGFGKDLAPLRHPRVDMISISAHKIYGPKGVGALVIRQSERSTALSPLMFGGGQERGLRPGTVPVHLVAGLGKAAQLATRDHQSRLEQWQKFRAELLVALSPLNPTIHGDPQWILPNVLNLRFGDIDSEAVMIALRDIVAISNGSACTADKYTPSHVLKNMGLDDMSANAAVRWSWSHLTERPDFEALRAAIFRLQ